MNVLVIVETGADPLCCPRPKMTFSVEATMTLCGVLSGVRAFTKTRKTHSPCTICWWTLALSEPHSVCSLTQERIGHHWGKESKIAVTHSEIMPKIVGKHLLYERVMWKETRPQSQESTNRWTRRTLWKASTFRPDCWISLSFVRT